MSVTVKTLLQAVMTLVAVVAIGLGLWWASGEAAAPASADGTRSTTDEAGATGDVAAAAGAVDAGTDAPTAEATLAPPTAEPTATVTPVPTATPVPEPVPFVELIGRSDLAETAASPVPDCTLTGGALSIAGTVELRCIEDWASVDVSAIGPGRIVQINREPAVVVNDLLPDGVPVGVFSWTAQAAIGPHVVVDHGPWAGSRNVQTVYAGLAEVDPSLHIGLAVDTGTVLGRIDGAGDATDAAAETAALQFSLWDTNVRQDGAQVVLDGPDLETQQRAAELLGAAVMTPTDPLCPLALGGGQLPGAARPYRNGIHQGIDFGCGTSDRYGTAIADGTVVYLIDDYADPTVADREALLYNAGLAGFTPHWTLLMLYGNVVVIDHGEFDDVGRVYTIAAHLEAVDPAIELGGTVEAGQVLGELGNRGTNASAQGRRGSQDPSLHLHWEIFVDNWYLGSGQPPATVQSLIATLLCGAAQTPGCPAA